ncbi:MAG: hypothetical protein Tsb0015_09520 [Simkaniaceae bacterium]
MTANIISSNTSAITNDNQKKDSAGISKKRKAEGNIEDVKTQEVVKLLKTEERDLTTFTGDIVQAVPEMKLGLDMELMLLQQVRGEKKNFYLSDEFFYYSYSAPSSNDIFLYSKEKMSKGGMGAIFKGVEIKNNKVKKVVLKQIKDTEKYRQIREGQEPLSISSKNIMKTKISENTSIGVLQVFPFYDSDLDAIAENNGVSFEESLDIAIQSAQGIADLHAEGYIHRDIKPGNIMVKKTDKGWKAKISDLDTVIKQEKSSSFVIGTLGTVGFYPRTVEKIGQPFTQETDMYAFGKTLEILFKSKTISEDKRSQLQNLVQQLTSDNSLSAKETVEELKKIRDS